MNPKLLKGQKENTCCLPVLPYKVFAFAAVGKRSRRLTPSPFRVGDTSIPVSVALRRGLRSITIRVSYAGEIVVTAPYGVSEARVAQALAVRRRWIARRLDRVSACREFLDPERWVMYDGGRFRVERDDALSPGEVQFDGDTGVCRVSPVRGSTIPVTIEKRLTDEARERTPREMEERAVRFGVHIDRITLRNQKTRWGSSSTRRTISLNWRIIMAPRDVRDYLMVHELAHQRCMNHSKEFWELVASWCPGYRACDSWLSEHAYLLSVFRR